MKILKLHRRLLQNEQHFQCMSDVIKLIESTDAAKLGIAELYAIFKDLFDQESNTMEFFRKSAHTQTIFELDALRDRISHGLYLLVEGFANSKQTVEQQAAANIRLVLDQYGDFRREDYNKESGIIANFIQDINSRCAADLLRLRLTRWITDLEDTNNDFKNLMDERYDEQAAKMNIKLRDIRTHIDKVYTQMMNIVESTSTYLKPNDAGINDFIARLNARLSDYQKMIALHQTNLAKGKGNEELIMNNE